MFLRKFGNFKGTFAIRGAFLFSSPPRSSGRISFQKLTPRQHKDFLLEYTPMPRKLSDPCRNIEITKMTTNPFDAPWCCYRDSWFLTIDAVEKSDAGKYICQLNTARPISISGTLSVVGEIFSSFSLPRIRSALCRIIFLLRST